MPQTFTEEEVREIAHMSAGCGAAAIMCKPGPAGEVVMPSEEILSGVERIITEHKEK